MVPIHLDALCLSNELSVVEAMADFTRLPYFNGERDVNPDTAYISEEIVSKPFQNLNLPLEPGIHLHWSLPDALTRATQEEEAEEPDHVFPAVPNRWLVTCCYKNGLKKQWIIESDYLYPEGEGNPQVSVNIPVQPALGENEYQPFRYLGRKIPLDEWQHDSGNAEYLEQLTAVGYGEPTFAAFYPNCYSVFGFYDNDTSNQSQEYEIIGWYSKPEQDPLKKFIARYWQNNDQASNEDLVEAIEQRFKWSVSLSDFRDSQQKIKHLNILCYARLSISWQNSGEMKFLVQNLSDPTIAVGNTGTEALSAYLASILDGSHKSKIEDCLEVLHLASRLRNQQLDIGPKFEEARHEKGFTAMNAGSLWTIKPRAGTSFQADAADVNLEIVLPEEMADQLNELNLLQQDYDQAIHESQSMRKQVFSDWYKYMLCAYPPEGTRDDYPDIDEVKHYIQNKGIAPLQRKISDTGELVLGRDESGNIKNASVSGSSSSSSLASQLAEAINGLLEAIALYNKALSLRDVEKSESYNLKQISSPRYWQPNEPVVLMTGEAAKPTVRHGQDGRLRDDGLLSCHVFQNDQVAYPLTREGFPEVSNEIDEIRKIANSADGRNFAFSIWTQNPWNPCMLEWEVEVFPIKEGSNLHPENRAYAKDFITDNYSLAENQVDLSLRDTRGATTKAANIYSGACILTPYASVKLKQELETNLIRSIKPRLLKHFYRDKEIPEEDQNDTWLCQNIHRLIEYLCNCDNASMPKVIEGKQVDEYLKQYMTQLTDWYRTHSEVLDAFNGDPENINIGDFIKWAEGQDDKTIKNFDQDFYQDFYDDEDIPEGDQGPDYLEDHIEELKAWFQLQVNTVIWVAAYESLDGLNCLSQSLGGFNEALLMHKQTMQLGIADPLGFDDYQCFAKKVCCAVQRSTRSAPQPLNDFNPIRSGAMSILRLRLIDTFGQIKDLDCSNAVTTEAMTVPDSDLVWLPPRLVQPARLNFRWLSASKDEQEMNDHPATTPICGWILPNNLDSSLMIYNNEGEALGSITINTDNPWQPAPGNDAAVEEDLIPNPHLRKMVKWILDKGASFLQNFISTLDNALENIEPENFAQHQALALLMGLPIAVVRASLNLELQGLPAFHQGWNVFREDMRRNTRETDDFTLVKFPIRIGEYRQFNDGVIGYWKEKGDDYKRDKFYAPQSTGVDGEHIKTHEDCCPINIKQTIGAPPQKLTILMDPRGKAHATTGILPTKEIHIPRDQYADALQSIEVTFLSTPILTDRSKSIRLSLPAEAGYTWSWLEKEKDKWSEISINRTIEKKLFVGKLDSPMAEEVWKHLLYKDIGWLKAIDDDQDEAIITAKDSRTSKELSKEFHGLEEDVEKTLDLYGVGIGQVSSKADFSGKQEIREGWLKLSKALEVHKQ